MPGSVATRMPIVRVRSRLFARQLLVDDFFEAFERLRAAEGSAVDEEMRRSRDAEQLGRVEVGVDVLLELARVDACVELRRVQSEIGRMLLQIGCRQLR